MAVNSCNAARYNQGEDIPCALDLFLKNSYVFEIFQQGQNSVSYLCVKGLG